MRSDFLRTPPAAVFAVLITVLLTGVSAGAQGRSVSIARRSDEFSKQTDKVARDQMADEASGRKPLSKEEARTAARIRTETKEDLESLQSSYNAIVSALSGGGQMPDADADDALKKIHKSAVRLRANVALPKLPEPLTVSVANERRREMQELCVQIYKFLTSPVIEVPSVIEPDSAMKASKALQAIIITSEKLKQKPL